MMPTLALIPDEPWAKTILQLGVAGLWLWWLTNHLKDQTKRDDKRHQENREDAKAHAVALERLTLTIYDTMDELSSEFPHAKQKVREVIRRNAKEAIDRLQKPKQPPDEST